MKSTHALAFFLVFLTACATNRRSRDPDPDPVAASRAEASAAGSRTEADLVTRPEFGRTFRSELPICFDAAMKVCRDRDYRIVSQQPSQSISAHAPAFDLMLTFTRTSDNRTRVTIRRNPDNREESKRVLDQLCDALLEPKE
jgi:hypothetical protein